MDPNNKKQLIDDQDRSTEGGPKGGLAFIIIVASFVLMMILVGVLWVSFF